MALGRTIVADCAVLGDGDGGNGCLVERSALAQFDWCSQRNDGRRARPARAVLTELEEIGPERRRDLRGLPPWPS